MRAVTIAVNEFSGLAGLLTPGVRVDLVATMNDNVSGETFAKTIVQNVEVSAVGQELEAGQALKNDPRNAPRAHKTVTLLVTPTQAAAIDLAFSKSKPRLVLRSADDEALVTDEGVTMAELSGRAEANRLNVTAENDTSSKVMEMLQNMQKQIQDVSKASQDAARKAAEDMAQQAAGSQPEEGAPVHSVRIFRGGAETTQKFNPDGSAAGTGGQPPAKPAAAKETQRVEAPAADEPARTAAAQ
jgi:Flp pilus assembly protein CpaB